MGGGGGVVWFVSMVGVLEGVFEDMVELVFNGLIWGVVGEGIDGYGVILGIMVGDLGGWEG